jgi:DNA processing protein
MTDQTPYWVALSRVPGIGPARTRLLLDRFGDASSAWNALYADLVYAGLDPKAADALVAARRTFDMHGEMEKIDRMGAQALTWESAGYPKRLLEVDDAPPVLYVLGEFTESDDWAVGVVGSRRSTGYGREAAARLSGELAAAGVTIVSGLARGVDSIAHSAALDAGGRTIAVLGCGLDVVYPPENRALWQRILDDGAGAIVTEYAVGTLPEPTNFPPRNRIISGLSLGVLVVEADEKSGALITVRFALEQGRDVFAIPTPKTLSTPRKAADGHKAAQRERLPRLAA